MNYKVTNIFNRIVFLGTCTLLAYIAFITIVLFIPEKKYENITIVLENCQTFKDRCNATGTLYEKPFQYYYMQNSDSFYYKMPSSSFIDRKGNTFKFSEMRLPLTSYGWQLRREEKNMFN